MSRAYDLILEAMRARRQVICTYKGLRREICPVVLGTSERREVMLAYQFGGRSSRPLAGPETRWRCLYLDEIADIVLRDGPWHAGNRHERSQSCVKQVDYDVNPESPLNPRYRL